MSGDSLPRQMVTAQVTLFQNGKQIALMYPAKWFFRKHESEPPTTEVAIRRGFAQDVYFALATFDAATGASFLTAMNPADRRAYYSVHAPDRGWQSYLPLLPDRPAPQGTLRQGPSVADVPGSGVVALVRDGEEQWHLKMLHPNRQP